MISHLVAALSTWRGPATTRNIFARRGFNIPTLWQAKMIEFCEPECSGALIRFWNECAAEVVLSGGRASPTMRKFDIEGTYRSAYLDDLASKAEYGEPPFRHPVLFRPLYEYYRRRYFDSNFARQWDMYFDQIKGEEARRHGISGDAWTGLKRDVRPIAFEFAAPLGYSRKGNAFRKESNNSLVFEIKIDGGGMPHVGSLPIYFNIFHKADTYNMFRVGFNAIAPGSECYHVPGTTADRAVLAVKASVELFDSFRESFEVRDGIDMKTAAG